MGLDGESGWRGLRGGVHGCEPRFGMARQPGYLGPEGQYRECVQPTRSVFVHRQSVAAVQPGGSLYGLQHSNPVNTVVAYKGPSSNYGQVNDPMVGGKIGGVNVFGGGLALYNAKKELIGAIGVSGDTSCADHNIAWRTRKNLNLDFVPVPGGGVGPAGRADNINYQGLAVAPVPVPSLQNDFSHPICKIAGVDGVSAISAVLPLTQ